MGSGQKRNGGEGEQVRRDSEVSDTDIHITGEGAVGIGQIDA